MSDKELAALNQRLKEQHDNDDDSQGLTLPRKVRDKLKAWGRARKADGWSPEEIRLAGKDYERDQLAEYDEEAEATEHAPAGTTPVQLNAINMDRSMRGLPALLPPEGEEPRPQHRPLSAQHKAAIEISRASMGLPKLSADEMESMTRGDNEQADVVYAAPGTSARQIALQNLHNATFGGPEIKPHPSDSKKA